MANPAPPAVAGLGLVVTELISARAEGFQDVYQMDAFTATLGAAHSTQRTHCPVQRVALLRGACLRFRRDGSGSGE